MTWLIDGNNDIDQTTNFLGTTNNQPLIIRTNHSANPAASERMRVSASGNVGIGTSDPRHGRLTLQDDDVPLVLKETNQAPNAGGLWRVALDGGSLRFDANSAAGGDFSSVATPLTMNPGGNVGIGTETTPPGARLTVAGGDITWGTNSRLARDQGGSIELGGDSNTAGTGSPYIDFHFQGLTQDFNTRIINDADGQLTISAGTLQTLGNLSVRGDITLGAGHTFSAPGRLHISGAEILYLLNGQGVVISRAWGGNGNLTAEGNLSVQGKVRIGDELFLGSSRTSITGFDGAGRGSGYHWIRSDGRDDELWMAFAYPFIDENGNQVAPRRIEGNAPFYGTFVRWSDARTKTNVQQLGRALDKLERIRGVAFNWAESPQPLGCVPGQQSIGVIAQEVEAVFPELVSAGGTQAYKAVDYSGLTGVLIEAAKELKAEIEALRSRIEAVEWA